MLDPDGVCTCRDARDPAAEKERLLAAISEVGGNRSRAAKLLGVSRRTLYDWLERHGVA